MHPREIIQFPMVTEKSTEARLSQNKYIFKVHPAANKLEIKKALDAKAEMFPDMKYRPNFKKALANVKEVKRLASGVWREALEKQNPSKGFKLDNDDSPY